MSGTDALVEVDNLLNEMYNEYAEDEEYLVMDVIEAILAEVDRLYNEYAMKGD